MPYRTIPNTDVVYALIAYDANGAERRDDPDGVDGLMSRRIFADARAAQPTDIFFFSHGWKGDVPAAVDQYNRWIKAMATRKGDAARMGAGFKPLWIGLHWPSQPWGDDELGATSFSAEAPRSGELIERYVERLGGDAAAVRSALEVIFAENDTNAGATTMPPQVSAAYARLAAAIGRGEGAPGGAPGEDDRAFDAVAAFDAANEAGDAFGGFSLGGLLGPLRQLSFWTMKRRARTVGEGGMHDFLKTIQKAMPNVKLHLMGHSFGCIVATSMIGGPGGTALPLRPVDSLVLVQGAVSLWAYADSILGGPEKGYFQKAIGAGGVRGPVVVTRSRHDTAVGAFYPVAAGLVGQVDFATLPRFGAIGAFGIQGRAGTGDMRMMADDGEYGFIAGRVYGLESSQYICRMDGASGAHSDIDGPQVAHAIWQAALV